jgi:hypothetical protein
MKRSSSLSRSSTETNKNRLFYVHCKYENQSMVYFCKSAESALKIIVDYHRTLCSGKSYVCSETKKCKCKYKYEEIDGKKYIDGCNFCNDCQKNLCNDCIYIPEEEHKCVEEDVINDKIIINVHLCINCLKKKYTKAKCFGCGTNFLEIDTKLNSKNFNKLSIHDFAVGGKLDIYMINPDLYSDVILNESF